MFWPVMAFVGKVILATLMLTALYVVLRICIGVVIGDLFNVFFDREEDAHDVGGTASDDASVRGEK